MKQFIKNLSIKSKITLVILITSSCAVIFSNTVDLIYDLNMIKTQRINNAVFNARLIGEYCTTALDFNYPDRANEILAKLRTDPRLLYGQVYNINSELFAFYSHSGKPAEIDSIPVVSTNFFEGDLLYAFEPIFYLGEYYGSILLVIDSGLTEDILSILTILIFNIILTMVFAYIFAILMQKFISKPILLLSQELRKHSQNKSYHRIRKYADDEIGVLFDEYNNLLDSLEKRELERDSAEQQIQKLNVELENKVLQRTKELENAYDKLSRTFEKEKELSMLKTRFITMVSHEYRTPLTVILSSAHLIGVYAEGELSQKIRIHLNKIENSVKLMTSLLEDVITLGKSEEGRINVSCRWLDINTLIVDTVEEIQITDNSSHKFEIDFHLDDKKVYSDDKLIKQILTNLYSNSCKYSEPDSVIKTTVLQKGDNIEIAVIDNGIGITELEIERLFEPFYRKAELIGSISGAGLGLAIVKRSVDLLGGYINVKSKLNEGSVFIVTIPRVTQTNTLPPENVIIRDAK